MEFSTIFFHFCFLKPSLSHIQHHVDEILDCDIKLIKALIYVLLANPFFQLCYDSTDSSI